MVPVSSGYSVKIEGNSTLASHFIAQDFNTEIYQGCAADFAVMHIFIAFCCYRVCQCECNVFVEFHLLLLLCLIVVASLAQNTSVAFKMKGVTNN